MGAEITVFADHDGLDAKLGATLPLEDKRTLPSHQVTSMFVVDVLPRPKI